MINPTEVPDLLVRLLRLRAWLRGNTRVHLTDLELEALETVCEDLRQRWQENETGAKPC